MQIIEEANIPVHRYEFAGCLQGFGRSRLGNAALVYKVGRVQGKGVETKEFKQRLELQIPSHRQKESRDERLWDKN